VKEGRDDRPSPEVRGGETDGTGLMGKGHGDTVVGRGYSWKASQPKKEEG